MPPVDRIHALDAVRADALILGVVMHSAAQLQANAQDSGGGININLLHLWFLYYLMIFYAITLTVRQLVHAVDKNRVIAAACDRVIALLMRGIWGPLLIGLPLAFYFLGNNSNV